TASVAWRAQFPNAVELPCWGDLLWQNVPTFDLDFDAILATMYAFTDSAEGDCYLSVPPDPGIEAAALGASAIGAPGTGESAAPGAGESALSGTAPTEALHTFTLNSGASRSFFRDSTTLTPLSRPVAVSLADPYGGPVLAHSSTVLPCPSAPSGLLSGLHLPSFSTNLVSGADLQDAWVDQFTPGGQRVTHCTCSRTGRHLATSSRESAPCSCRPLSHETLLWHHRLGHPSLPLLRGMASRTLVSDLPRSLPPLPPGPAPTCVPCVEGRQRAAPHSSTFPPTEAPLQTLQRRLTDAWRTQFPDAVELPRWHDLLLQNVPIFDLDFDAILAAMYALADNDEGDCYLSVPPDPGIAAAALGASASAAPGTSASAAPGGGAFSLSGTAPTESLHTFTLDSDASRSFFRDSTTLTPLSRPVAVSLADPSGGPLLAHSSTVLPCPAAPSGLLSGLHLPSFSTNLVSGADLQDAWVDQFTPGGQRVTHCTCSRTGRHLATFTRRPGSSLYTLTTTPPPVSASSQVAASSQVFAAASRSSPASAPCSCRSLAHETLLWHHRLGHPSLPRLRGMASRALVSGIPRSLPPLALGPAPTCVPCVEGRQHAAPHSSFPPTEAPLQTLHMDVWGPARVRGQGHERYFVLVVDDYSRYTTVFPLRIKGEVTEVLIDWIRGARRQLSEQFGSDLPVLRLHSDRGCEFSSDLSESQPLDHWDKRAC
ncbi:unnamed protein product, partial [Closterium sp. NIES-54]